MAAVRAGTQRGVDVRGLVWRSHTDALSYSKEENRALDREIEEDGGKIVLDQRVRRVADEPGLPVLPGRERLARARQYGQQPQAASDAPRWKWGQGLDVDFEPTMAPALREGLKVLGHRFEPAADSYLDFGSGQFIARLSGDLEDGYVAASDSRRDGQAAEEEGLTERLDESHFGAERARR